MICTFFFAIAQTSREISVCTVGHGNTARSLGAVRPEPNAKRFETEACIAKDWGD